jgi:hypothetical protein
MSALSSELALTLLVSDLISVALTTTSSSSGVDVCASPSGTIVTISSATALLYFSKELRINVTIPLGLSECL